MTSVKTGGPAAASPAPAPAELAPMFRRVDWLAALLTFGVIWVVYLLTVAPELTLEDSGELVTGSYYAGIPHPPGYPVWTIYSWLWTVIVPWGNPAWRVALAEAFAGACASGLIALLVSRGGSMLVEGIEELKGVTGKWESAICLISGAVAGLLTGLDGFMWRESVAVNRIAVSSVPVFLLVLVMLMRWFYRPQQKRYAYWAAFIFGICYTTHQSLIIAALGFEVAIALGNPRIGRDVFLGNFVIYLAYWIHFSVSGQHLFHNIGAKSGLLTLFNAVGLGSLVGCVWLTIRTKRLGTETLSVILMAALWGLGVSFYLYMPIAGMTNPPMQWGYPRTIEGFWHALTRGQYEQPNPTDVLADPSRFLGQLWMLVEGVKDEFSWAYIFIAIVPFLFLFKMQRRERAWILALSAMYFCLGVLMMILMNPTPDLASAELIKVFFNSSHTVVVCLMGYGLALVAAYMATHYERFRIWGITGAAAAAGLAVFSLWDVIGDHYLGLGKTVKISDMPYWIGHAFAPNQDGLPVIANLILVALTLAFVAALVIYRHRAPLLITLSLFSAMPLYSVLSHYHGSDQHNHWFGYWFGHDMFTPPFKGSDGKPIYPEMTKDAILYGGTDPGRFCPTYMVFCESFTPHECQPLEDQKFDRRDVYIITQNALADGTYLNYIRAHYNRSTQIDPPFFRELARYLLRDKDWETNLLARALQPLDRFFTNLGDSVEKRRRVSTSFFTAKDFTDLPALRAKLAPGAGADPLAKYLYDQCRPATRQLIDGKGSADALAPALAQDLNEVLEKELAVKRKIAGLQVEKAAVDQEIAEGTRSGSAVPRQAALAKEIADLSALGPFYTPERFKNVKISEYLADFIKENPQSHTRIRLNRLLLEAAFPKEIARSLGGVYPDREMYIATPEDSQHCFQEYMNDAQRRMQLNQLRPGEDVRVVDNRVQVSGQVAVMAINGLLTKVMFDHNPKNEFFVEESFPLDWMYPHLTPYGIIMKINRQPLPTLTDDILKRDHDFWKQYSKRMTGDIIDYGTPVKKVAEWIEKTYIRHDYSGFTGDLKFVRDRDGQKAFSKLRSSIGGIYAWRLNPNPLVRPAEYGPKNNAELQAILREADFSFLQAFAFCPYSPEAVFRYAQLLLQFNRLDDAIIVADTCLELDPFNASIQGLQENLKKIKSEQSKMDNARNNLQGMEEQLRKNPTDIQSAFTLASAYLGMQQTGRAAAMLDIVLANPAVDPNAVLSIAKAYADMQDFGRLETTLDRLVKVAPANPEAWYDLAAMKANLSKPNEAIPALKRALELNSERLKREPTAQNLLEKVRSDERFGPIRQTPEYQRLVRP